MLIYIYIYQHQFLKITKLTTVSSNISLNPHQIETTFFIFRCQLCLIQGPRAGVYLLLLLWNIIIIKEIIMLAKHHNIITKVDIYKSVYVHICVLDRNIVRVAPSGLGLPDRTYYTRFPNDSAIQVSLRSSLH